MPVPTDPSNLVVTAQTPTSVSLSWTPGTGQTSQVLSVFDGAHNSLLFTFNPGVTAAQGTATGLSSGTTYVFRIQAFNGSGNSGFIEVTGATVVPASWYYDDENGVALVMGNTSLDVESNLENTTTDRDRTTVLADGQASDVIVNGMLAKADISPVPVVQANVPTYIWGLLELGSRYLTAGLLCGHRAWYGLENVSQDVIQNMATGFEARGKEFVEMAIAALQRLSADDTATQAGAFVQVPMTTACTAFIEENAQ